MELLYKAAASHIDHLPGSTLIGRRDRRTPIRRLLESDPCSTSSTSPSGRSFCCYASATPSPATRSRPAAMAFDMILGGVVTVFVLGYLIFALIRPERF